MILENAIDHYYPEVQHALLQLTQDAVPTTDEGFTPGPQLPELTSQVRDYLSVSSLAHTAVVDYQGHAISLLDLTRNPATKTTKTFASLVIAARAVRFIRDTGQRVTIVTPSSANKAVALRDAVLRAIKCGLISSDELNIVAIVPAGSSHKLRNSELSTDSELRRRNPIAVYTGSSPGAVKTIATSAVNTYRGLVESTAKTNIWYTLKLENYLGADVVRAYAENDFFPSAVGRRRLHAHAVSSAYGLLGHAYGRQLLQHRATSVAPGYFLVQHLGAPDMVLGLYGGGGGGFDAAPRYTYDNAEGVYRQGGNRHFPHVTFDPDEVLDSTFYTRNPPTIPRMNALIRAHGGGGIVVSLKECLDRFGQVRMLLRSAGIVIPSNPSHIQEWSLVMAFTGVLNAIDRGLVDVDDIVVHGSGSYFRGEIDQLGSRDLQPTCTDGELRDLILKASVL
jgi:hypothetical protein